jgi:hypothetical protein
MNKLTIKTILKSAVILLAFSITASVVMAQDRVPSANTKLTAHCASLIKTAQEEELNRLATLKPERVRQVLSRHSHAMVRASDMQAVFTCLAQALTAAE